MPPRVDASAQRDASARGDYKVVAKHTRSTRARGSTCPTKKPCCSLTTELAKELPSPQQALEAARVAADVSEPITATQETTSKVYPIVYCDW